MKFQTSGPEVRDRDSELKLQILGFGFEITDYEIEFEKIKNLDKV